MNPFLDLLLFLATLIYSYLEAFVKLFVPVKRKSVSGELVLITGAGHGVGRATAFEFAKRRSRLVLWDINKVKKDIGDVSILVNNAGVITAADLLSTQDHQIERMFEVNILAHIWTTRAFLPTMMNNNHGHIVTVASAAGHFVTSFMVQSTTQPLAYSSPPQPRCDEEKIQRERLVGRDKDGEGSFTTYGHGHKTGSTWGRNKINLIYYQSNQNKDIRK
uniref:Estradiol 17-beta-dehydrogenase 11 n=1 Tax=Accipiter nisus TaxID=211598 RepID=A0A8B9M043_9AVES